MKELWTGELIGRMHVHDITYDDLATEVGWVKSYVSMILNGQRSPTGAREKLETAVDAIIQRQVSE